MPPNKMERFTQRTRRVLSLAQEEAERLRHSAIGTEHLLLGLMREEGGVAGRVLRDLGLEQHKVEELVEELTRDTPQIPSQHLELSPGTKRVLELAVDEARRMGHHYIGTEHLMLGLVRQPEGMAIDVLKRLGISPEEVRRQTRRVLQESPVQNMQTATAEAARQKELKEILVENAVVSHTRLFELINAVTTKVLEMVADKKLTTEQGKELMSTLLPEITLTPGEQIQLASQFKRGEGEEKRRLRVTLTNKDNEQSPLSFTFGLEAALQNVDILFSAILNNQTEALVFDNGESTVRVEVQIEEDQE